MAVIQAVVFDLYGTLIYLAKESKPYARLFTDLGLQTPEEFRQARGIALTEDIEDLAALIRRLRPDANLNPAAFQQELDEEKASATLYPETRDVLSRLKGQKIRLGLISNLASPYKKPFFNLGLNEYFDGVVFSCDVGLKKPDRRIYEKMIERLAVDPAKILMTGDKVPDDVEGPDSAGINAVHLERISHSSGSISTLEGIFNYL